jgi:hypothetical protein
VTIEHAQKWGFHAVLTCPRDLDTETGEISPDRRKPLSSPWYPTPVNFHLCAHPRLRQISPDASAYITPEGVIRRFRAGLATIPASSAPAVPAATPAAWSWSWFHDRVVVVAVVEQQTGCRPRENFLHSPSGSRLRRRTACGRRCRAVLPPAARSSPHPAVWGCSDEHACRLSACSWQKTPGPMLLAGDTCALSERPSVSPAER